MRSTTYCLFAVAFLLTPFSATGLTEVSTDQKVTHLRIKKHVGGKTVDLDTSALLGLVKTREGQPYSLADFDNDLKRLARVYSRVEPEIRESPEGLKITLNVFPKRTIGAIHWSGNRQFSSAKLNKTLEIKSGEFFSSQSFSKAIHRIKGLYLKNGFFETQVNFSVREVTGNDHVDVDLTVAEGKRGYIKKILFEGLSKKEEDQFLQFVLSRPYRPILSAILNSGRYDPEMANQDSLILVEYLQNLGYSDAKARVDIISAINSDFVDLKFSADKGELYTVGEVGFEGQKLFSEAELRENIKVKTGSPLSPTVVQKCIQTLSALYGSKGYIDTQIDAQINFRDSEETVQDIKFQIQEGTCSRVGLIKVRGNLVTEAKVILHECHLVPGDVLDQRKLRASELRLANTELFESVHVLVAKSSSIAGAAEKQNDLRDILIEVTEKGTGKFNFSLGMSKEELGFLGFGISEQNFNVRGLKSIPQKGLQAIRGGGQNISLDSHISRSIRNLNLSWTEPHWRDGPWTVGIDLDYTTRKVHRSHYRTQGRGAGLFANYPLNAFTYFQVHYRLKHTSTKATADASARLREEAKNSGVISAAGIGWHYNSTESVFKPSKGFISKADVEIAGLGGNFQFLRWGYTNRYYIPVKDWGTFKLMGNLHLVQPYRKTNYHRLPLSERLYLGGDTSIRGYRQDYVGPKFQESRFDPHTNQTVLFSDEPRGGLSSLLLSAEYLHHLGNLGVGGIDGFVFVDAGTVSDRAYKLDSTWVSTYGFGVRIDVAERIPLILGLGYPLHKPKDGRLDTQKFFFALGGTF